MEVGERKNKQEEQNVLRVECKKLRGLFWSLGQVAAQTGIAISKIHYKREILSGSKILM